MDRWVDDKLEGWKVDGERYKKVKEGGCRLANFIYSPGD